MSIHRIKISMLHTWYHFTHSMETWVDLFWNSSLQMLIFAFIAVVFSNESNPLQGTYMIAGMVFWNILWSAQYGITLGILWEIWSHSLSSLFMTPLTLEEFLIGQALSAIIKALVAVMVTATIAWFVYHFSLTQFGWWFWVYFIELFAFGLSMGMVVLSMIFRWGTDVQSLSWSMVFLVQPIGAVFYPVSVLPPFIQKIAWCLPPTYVFETIRQQIRNGTVNGSSLLIATLVNTIFFIVSYLILHWTHQASKRSGAFARLEG